MNPYVLAFAASLFFGVVTFPWQATVRLLGPAGFLAFTGAVYLVVGLGVVSQTGLPTELSWRTGGTALITALLYVAALLLCSKAFAMQDVNIPVAAAITAAYPAWTAIISVVMFRQRMSLTEMAFFLMVLVGVIGLTISSGQQASKVSI